MRQRALCGSFGHCEDRDCFLQLIGTIRVAETCSTPGDALQCAGLFELASDLAGESKGFGKEVLPGITRAGFERQLSDFDEYLGFTRRSPSLR